MPSDLENRSLLRRWWRIPFPLRWLSVLTLLWIATQISGALGVQRDYRMAITIALANLAWIGVTLWLLFRWRRVRELRAWKRWGLRLAAVTLATGVFASIKVEYDGDLGWRGIRWRWVKAHDERLRPLASRQMAADWAPTPHDYPRFLGREGRGEVPEVQLETDWRKHPPRLVWRHPIGAGWSSCAIVGPYFVTQEQRGDQELVTCYRLDDGKPVWSHADRVRHEPGSVQGGMGGVGPRATPTLHEQHVYTMGATGVANCLDAATGKLIWSRSFRSPEDYEPLLWGNSGSPLVLPELGLVVFNVGRAADSNTGSLVALDRFTGETKWQTGPPITSYASPVAATIHGIPQIVQVNESTVAGYRASDGKALWEFPQPGQSSGAASCSQPIPLPNNQILVSKGYGEGARLYQIVADDAGNFDTRQVWQKNVMQTKFANLVVDGDFAYGLDQTILACIRTSDGKREWKKRRTPRWGHGQVMRIGDSLLVLTETGEGVLVACQPDSFVELASMQLLTDEGVTWNNPAFSAPYLLVRNHREIACYELPLRSESPELAAAEQEQDQGHD